MTTFIVQPGDPEFPAFEGKDVHAAILKISAGAGLEISDEVVHMDDVVVIQLEAVVTAVDHRVHAHSGQLIRVQAVKAVGARVVRD